MPATPNLASLELAGALRDLRLRAGLSGTEAGNQVGMSQSRMSKLETAKLRVDPETVESLCGIYGATASERAELAKLAREAIRKPATSRVILSRDFTRLQDRITRLEHRSTLLRAVQPAMILGLLQTADYARTMMGAELPGDLEPAVAARVARRSALDDPHRTCVLILTEGALRWQLGDPGLMARQLDYISELSHRPNVRIGIVPWTTPTTATLTHAFHLYDSAAVIFGTEVAQAMLTETDDVATYEKLFTRIEGAASFDDAGRAELARVAADYRRLGE